MSGVYELIAIIAATLGVGSLVLLLMVIFSCAKKGSKG